jgi:hypothetical protein
VLLGDSGTGKSHVLIGLGVAACERGRRVRYASAAQLVNELAEAADERRLSRIVARYGRLDLLCLDELGYVQLDTRGAELLCQILTEREEKASVALATNLPFSEWGSVIPDPRLVAAIVDRVTFNAYILETGTDSYRLRTTRTRARRKTPRASRSPAPNHPPPSPRGFLRATQRAFSSRISSPRVGPDQMSTVGPIPVARPLHDLDFVQREKQQPSFPRFSGRVGCGVMLPRERSRSRRG